MTEEEKESKWEFYIAGVQHHHLHKVIGDLSVGQHLSLTPEPTNKFDKTAVRIELVTDSRFPKDTTTMLGYVPGKLSAEVTAVIVRPGKTTSCKILELNPEAKPWLQCKVLVEGKK